MCKEVQYIRVRTNLAPKRVFRKNVSIATVTKQTRQIAHNFSSNKPYKVMTDFTGEIMIS